MLYPSLTFDVYRRGQRNLYGESELDKVGEVAGAIVRLRAQDRRTAVRADSSASGGAAREIVIDTRFLIAEDVVTNGDVLGFRGALYQIDSTFPRYDILGEFDHLEVDAGKWPD
tara:strand:- start:163 stop:504 length:342 start_codon:yes stop_codon:yes gene_type:complete